MKDIFRPKSDPARAIYDAFQEEAEKRRYRSSNEWIDKERAVVLFEATKQAAALDLICPTMKQVEAAEIYAVGHVDFGKKWALAIERIMRGYEL